MNKEQAKNLFKIVAIVYLASFLIINWNEVSWAFNYKEVSGLVGDFFNPYPSIGASSMNTYFYPNHSQEAVASAVKEAKTTYTEKQNTLEIPAISLVAPIVFSSSAEKNSIMKDLDKGVVYYPGSVYPGKIGQIIILGHSAPVGWPKIKHDWVFTEIDKLKAGDKILIDINNKQYTYIVRRTIIIKRGEDISTDNFAGDSNVLTLISCWPPGKDYQRIAVQAELENK